ncbi:hypothetical protein ACZ87_01879 [Candidatus Erwinia dacicola]|uniref:Uncharacterized protein n=1 Tax=Candidatus Erwinia dacicola TaxID=252393 RepID=A0A328TMB5_9GAMM|nr:hypothetical protein ACZ87_01879 [Candidatus Erwinia dacicola]
MMRYLSKISASKAGYAKPDCLSYDLLNDFVIDATGYSSVSFF